MIFRRRVPRERLHHPAGGRDPRQVRTGDLPFDRTMRISTAEENAKEKIAQRIPNNLDHRCRLLELNRADWELLRAERLEREAARPDRRAIATAPAQAGRADRGAQPPHRPIIPLMYKLRQHLQEDADLETDLARPSATPTASTPRTSWSWREELEGLRSLVLETPDELADHALKRHRDRLLGIRAGQARPLGRQPPPRRLDRQEVPQPRPVLPRHHPGGQHRPDARRGQVRVQARLQVLAPTPPGGSARPSPAPSPTTPAPSASRCT
jgi:hypothetical protein